MAFLVASTLAVASPSPALAECMTWPDRATDQWHVGYAFTGTVVGVSKDEDPEQGGSPLYFWHVTVDVEDVYRGRIPDPLVLDGSDWGCSFLYVQLLAEGDRILMASERLRPGVTDETDLGNVLLWKRSSKRWVFEEEALQDGSNHEFYPRAARTARTMADILRLISGAALPDTSTTLRDQVPASGSMPVLAAILASSLGLLLMRRQLDGGSVSARRIRQRH